MATITDVFSGRTQYYGQMVVNQGTQSVEGNYTDVGFSLDIIESPEWGSYSFGSSSFSWNINGTPGSGTFTYDFRGGVNSKALASGSVRIYHNADGTMPSFGFSFSITAASPLGSAAASGSMGLTTIPRATQPTVSPTSGNTGSTYTIGISPASASFRHDVFYSLDGGSSYTIFATDIAGNTTWTPAHTLLPNSTSVTAVIAVNTKSGVGGTFIGQKTVNLPLTVPSSVKPTVSSVSWVEAQTSAPDLVTMMGGAGRFVQGWSKLKPTVTSAGAGGSTVVSSSVTQNGQVTASGTAFGLPVALSGAVPYSASVIDSRNVTSDPYANTVAVTAYNFPNLPTPLVTRTSDAAGNIPSPTGTYLAITPGVSVSSLLFGGVQKNVLEWQVRTMPVGGAWTTKQAWTSTGVSGTTWVSKYVAGSGYLSNTEYLVEVSVRDVFGKNGYNTASTIAVVTVKVPSESVFFDWDGVNGVGLGKYRQNGMLDVAGAIYQNGGQAVIDAAMLAAMQLVTPSGTILAYGGSAAPNSSFYICDGSAKNTTTDAALFAVIGYTYGGSGTSFNLPNGKGRALVGLDAAQSEFNVLGETGGEKNHSLTTGEIPAHQHGLYGHAWNWGSTAGINNVYVGGVNVAGGATPANNPMTSQNYWNVTLTDGGAGGSHNNLQPYLVTNYIIKR